MQDGPTPPNEPDEPAETVALELDDGPVDVVATARRRHGAAGAIVAAGMLGLDQALTGRKVREEAPIVVASPTEPTDLDHEGIEVPIDGARSAWAPPQPVRDPFPAPRPRRRR